MINRYVHRAKIIKLKGNCFDIQFEVKIPSLGIDKDDQIPNVPKDLFIICNTKHNEESPESDLYRQCMGFNKDG